MVVITYNLNIGGPEIYFRPRSPAILIEGFISSCISALLKLLSSLTTIAIKNMYLLTLNLLHEAESFLIS